MSTVNDISRGNSALQYFHNEALKFDSYNLSFTELKQHLSDISHGQFLDGFGFAISSSGATDEQVQNAMIKLADDGAGRVPENMTAFFSALSGETTKVNFIDAAKYVTVESVADISSGVAAVGDKVIEAGKNAIGFLPYIPFVLAAAGLYILAKKTKHYA